MHLLSAANMWFSATECILDLSGKTCNVLKYVITNRDIRKILKMLEKLFPCSDEDDEWGNITAGHTHSPASKNNVE